MKITTTNKMLNNMMNRQYNVTPKYFNSYREMRHAEEEQSEEVWARMTKRNISRMGNTIYFSDSIDDETQLIFQQLLKQTISDLLRDHVGEIMQGEFPEEITIILNSLGGSLSSGFAIFDTIKESIVPIKCIVAGTCCSAATLIFLACECRHMTPNSSYLMHQCSWGGWGQDRLMQDSAENAKKAMVRLRKIYMEETNLGANLEEKERELYIQNMLEHDTEYYADECISLGICEPEEDENLVKLNEENVAKLQAYAEKLAKEQKKEEEAVLKSSIEKTTPKKESKPKSSSKKETKEVKETKVEITKVSE